MASSRRPACSTLTTNRRHHYLNRQPRVEPLRRDHCVPHGDNPMPFIQIVSAAGKTVVLNISRIITVRQHQDNLWLVRLVDGEGVTLADAQARALLQSLPGIGSEARAVCPVAGRG